MRNAILAWALITISSTIAAAQTTCFSVKKWGTYGVGSYYSTQCNEDRSLTISQSKEALMEKMAELPYIESFKSDSLIVHSNDPRLLNASKVCATLNWEQLTSGALAKLMNPKSAKYTRHYRHHCDAKEVILKNDEYAYYVKDEMPQAQYSMSYKMRPGMLAETDYFYELTNMISYNPKIILITQ